MIAGIRTYRNILIKNNINLREAANQRAASNHVTPMWQSNVSDFPQRVLSFQSYITSKFVEIPDKTIAYKLTNAHEIDLLTSHAES